MLQWFPLSYDTVYADRTVVLDDGILVLALMVMEYCSTLASPSILDTQKNTNEGERFQNYSTTVDQNVGKKIVRTVQYVARLEELETIRGRLVLQANYNSLSMIKRLQKNLP